MDITQEEKAVLDVIMKHTSENKIFDGQIRYEVRVSDPDSKKKGAGLRRVINSLRQKGYPICSDVGGYWYAQSKEELEENYNALKGRACKILEAASGMKLAIDKYEEIKSNKLF